MRRLALVAALLAVAVGAVAVADHRHKRAVELAAQEDAWFCAHGQSTRCRAFDEGAYEQRWEDRELAYRIAVFAFGTATIGFGLAGLRSGRLASDR